MSIRVKQRRFPIVMGTFICSVCGFLYFTAIRPMIDPEPYKLVREKVLPKLPKAQ